MLSSIAPPFCLPNDLRLKKCNYHKEALSFASLFPAVSLPDPFALFSFVALVVLTRVKESWRTKPYLCSRKPSTPTPQRMFFPPKHSCQRNEQCRQGIAHCQLMRPLWSPYRLLTWFGWITWPRWINNKQPQAIHIDESTQRANIP